MIPEPVTSDIATHDRPGHDKGKCSVCQYERPFVMPLELVEAVQQGEVVLFAGAGVSTETEDAFPVTLYEEVCSELGIAPTDGPAYPDLMSKYCDQPNGRPKLLQKIDRRFRYAQEFPEVYRSATRFHQELATVYQIDSIFTTNWDDYFERECDARPFVTGDDFAFWRVPGRKVVKLHGSINGGYGTVVATREEYEACYKSLSTELVGSSLKMALATKTILYIGFSFSDDDFIRIHDLLTAEMRGLRPQSYIVTLDDSADVRLREHRLTPIYTDATFFLRTLKSMLRERTDMLPDERYAALPPLYETVRRLHHLLADSVDVRRVPGIIYPLAYQDGLMHGVERILALRKSGRYSHECNLHATVRAYHERQKETVKERRYGDAAYIEGFINAHLFFAFPDEERSKLPLYFMPGYKGDLRSLKKCLRVARQLRTLHRLAFKHAERWASAYGADGIVPHHRPFL